MKNELYNEVLNHIARGYNKKYKGSIFEEGLSNAELKKRVQKELGKETKKKESIHFEYSSDVTFSDRKLMEKVRAKTGRDLRSTYILVMRYKLGKLTEEDLYKPYNKPGRKPNELQRSSP